MVQLSTFDHDFDAEHQEAISWMGIDQHLKRIKDYWEVENKIRELLEEAQSSKQFGQCAVYATFLRTLSHKITNHYTRLACLEIEAEDMTLDELSEELKE